MHTHTSIRLWGCLAAALLVLGACGEGTLDTPLDREHELRASRGKLTGDGLTLLGSDEDDSGSSPLGVNGFLWRATLDTLAFLPLAMADPFGGVVLTNWYENPKTPGERFKVNALILDRSLRADGIRLTVFKQVKSGEGEWRDAPVDAAIARKLEDTILTRARQMKVEQLTRP